MNNEPIATIGEPKYCLAQAINCAGYIHIGGGWKICPSSKPNRFHLFMLRLAFGWTWEDA